MQMIAREVERLRRLEFKRLPEPEYVSPGEDDPAPPQEVDEAPQGETRRLAARAPRGSGRSKPGTDLGKPARNELADDVAGYYEQGTTSWSSSTDDGEELERRTSGSPLPTSSSTRSPTSGDGLPGDPKKKDPPPTVRRDDESTAAGQAP